ncbi:MAG TPA: hypothetical protein VFL29_01955 [Candidatus Dormibacteraeota bacterium]|nr:hypothetical protein [Candidatus Dormibacteraeota bacterium]
MPVQTELEAPPAAETQVAPPRVHQAAPTPARRRVPVVWPILLILGGALILLVNLGTLPEDTGWRLLQLWPLLLVMLGVEILVPLLIRGAAVTVVTLLLVGTIAAGGFAYALAGPSIATASYARFQSTSPLTGETAATIRIDDAADRITINAGDTGSQLYEAKIDYDGSAPSFSYADGQIRITRSSNFINSWGRARDVIDLTVNPSVAWTVVIDGAGTTATIDLSHATLQSFTLNGAGSNVTITVGPPLGPVRMSADGVGIQLTLRLPAAVDYRVTADGIGTGVNGTAQTPGWPTAQNRYDVTANGVGTHVTVTTTG